MSGGICRIDPERVAAWHARWQCAHARNWLEQENGLLMPRLLAHHQPIVAAIHDEPHSASVIRDLEVNLNGRVLSPAPKERP